MVTNELKALAAATILNKLLKNSFFNICDVDRAADVLGHNQHCEEYELLRGLHCVDYAKMPRALREKIPGLVQTCLGIESVPEVFAPMRLDLEMFKEEPKQKSWKFWLVK